MILDALFSLVSSLLAGLLSHLPFVHVSIPFVNLAPVMLGILMLNQLLPLDVLVSLAGLLLALRSGLIVWRLFVFIWEHLPILGHGAL